jgi:cation/acetate symporter
MVLGIFWPRMTRAGAVGGMLTGLGVTVYYMAINLPVVRQSLDLQGDGLWWGIQPISAGVFGVPAGLVAGVLCSWLGRPDPVPDRDLAPHLG